MCVVRFNFLIITFSRSEVELGHLFLLSFMERFKCAL